MKNKRFTVGTKVFIGCFNEQDISRSGIFEGIIEKDGGSYYCVNTLMGVSEVWSDENVFGCILDAANYCREQAEQHIGQLTRKIYRTNIFIEDMRLQRE